MRARALILPDGYDPDDYVRKFGQDKMEDLIALAQPLSDYYIENVIGGGRTFEDKRDMVKTAMTFLSKIGDQKEKNLFIKRIAEKTGLNEELLIREAYSRVYSGRTETNRNNPAVNVHHDTVELHLIQLMMEYPQKIVQVENENVLDYFLQPDIRKLGEKIIDAYKLLGFVDVGVILSTEENQALRERIFQLMIKALPAEDDVLGKILTDNIRQIKKRWFKEQHRQIKIKLSRAQDSGNEEMVHQLLYEKEQMLIKEKELQSTG